MIREYKSEKAPASLSSRTRYDGPDVVKQLFADHHGKCYLCELKAEQHYEIEHIKSQHNYGHLTYEWTNLLLTDGYCNSKKLSVYDDILNPNECNIEEIIEQRIDSGNRVAIFTSSDTSQATQSTIAFLTHIYNGTHFPKLRNWREEIFYKEVECIYNAFIMTVLDYLKNMNLQTEQAVRDELSIDKELLGFKYWVIMENPQLRQVFANDIKWNKK